MPTEARRTAQKFDVEAWATNSPTMRLAAGESDCYTPTRRAEMKTRGKALPDARTENFAATCIERARGSLRARLKYLKRRRGIADKLLPDPVVPTVEDLVKAVATMHGNAGAQGLAVSQDTLHEHPIARAANLQGEALQEVRIAMISMGEFHVFRGDEGEERRTLLEFAPAECGCCFCADKRARILAAARMSIASGSFAS